MAIYSIKRQIGPFRAYWCLIPLGDGSYIGCVLYSTDEATLRLEWDAEEVTLL